MKCKFYFSLLLLFLSVLCSPAPTPNFSSPPFNAHDFIVDQPNNNISLRGSSNTIPIGVYPVKITNLTGTNYYSIDSTGVPSGYILLTTNNTVAYFPFSGGAGVGTLTNVVFTNAGPSDTYVIGNISYLKTNSFSGSGGTTYFFNTNDFSVTGTNVNLSSNIPHTNSANTFYGTQTFQSRINVGIPALTVLQGNGSGSSANGAFSWTASGDITATSFTGIGSGLTALNASSLSSGTVSFARLPSDVVTNIVFTNSGPDSTTINNLNYVNTNKFGGGGGGGGITALTGDVTASGSGSVVATLANIPTSTPMAGSLFDTAIVAPATPASGKGQIYEDSTSKNLAIKNDAGVINHGVQTRTATANQWIRSIADDGSSTISQPAFTDISGTASAAQIPVATTSANGGVKVDGTSITITGGTISAVGNGLPTLGGNGTNETFWGITLLTNATSGNGVSFDGTSFLLDGVNLNTGPGGTIGGIGSGLVQLNASGISSGTVAIAFLPSTVLTNLVPTNALVPSVSGHTGFIPTNSASSGGSTNIGSIFPRVFNFIKAVNGANGFGLSTADFNGDGYPDMAVDTTSALIIYTNNRTGQNFVQSSTSAITLNAGANASADINGDGKIDMVVSSKTGFYSAVFTNDGTGIMAQLGTNYTYGSTTTPGNAYITTGILNGDSNVDYVVSASGFQPQLMTNNGSGIFVLSTNFPSFLNSSYVVAADFNGDGITDLSFSPPTAVSGTTIFGTVIMTNNGSGVFQYWVTNTSPSATTAFFRPMAGDFNNDGKVDIYEQLPLSGGALMIYTNSGSGFVLFSSNSIPLVGGDGGAAVGDINNDGKLDIFVTSQTTSSTIILTNSGTGFSISSTNLMSAGAVPAATIVADFNLDGFLDEAAYNTANSAGVWEFLNTPVIIGNFIGNGAGITNLPISVSFSSTTLTPAASVTTNSTGTVINVATNYQVQTVAGDLRYQGNLGTATNLPSTNINFGLFPIQTNFISGQLYTNGYNRPVQALANIGITTAAVTGDAGMALWIISGVGRGTTNYESISTTVAVSLAMSYTNQLSGFIPTNAIYAFTNISSGAGNSATLIGGQIY